MKYYNHKNKHRKNLYFDGKSSVWVSSICIYLPTTWYGKVQWGPLQIQFNACLNTLKTLIRYYVQINY